MGIIEYYYIIINIIGFIVYLVNVYLYTYTCNGQIDLVLTITSLLGGGLGMLIPVLIFDRIPHKSTMLSRVFLFCMIVIHIVIYLVLRNTNLLDPIREFVNNHGWIIWYLIIINIGTFIAFGIDKLLAIKGKNRIRIITLLGLAFIGGAIGGMIAMKVFNHKTQKEYFYIGVPLILITHIILFLYLIFS